MPSRAKDNDQGAPPWRDAALLARRLQKTADGRDKGRQAAKKSKKQRPLRQRPGWNSKREISEHSVSMVVEGQYPFPDLSRSEAVLVARQLKDRGFSARHTAQRLGISERTVYRMLERRKTGSQGRKHG